MAGFVTVVEPIVSESESDSMPFFVVVEERVEFWLFETFNCEFKEQRGEHIFDGDVEQALVEDDEEEKGNAEEQEEETCMEEVD